jgi:chemotaxis protein methyltransferase CheR
VPPPDSPTPAPMPPGEPEPWSEADFAPIVAFLRNQIGITLEPHRMGLLQARLRSRLQARAYPSFTRFNERVLKADPTGPGMQLLIDLSTVNHTAFFREPGHFTFMAERLAPIFKDPTAGTVRIWSAGCSTGQEPYSMAMVLAETIPNLSPQKVEIWASDLSLEVVKVAARSIYQTRDVQGVSPARLRRFFLRGRGPREGSYRVVPEIRDLVKYRHLNLRDKIWPLPTDFHVILCRNVSIYFAEDERMELLDRLATSLRPGGWLAIGNGEILPGVPNALRKIAPSIYRKEAAST